MFWRLDDYFLLGRINLILLLFDHAHKLLDVLNWIMVMLLILPTTGTVHMLLLFLGQVLNNPLELRTEISL